MRSRETKTSSSAQPVMAREPVTPVMLFAGVSNEPNGAPGKIPAITFSVTGMGAIVLPAPGAAIVIEPVAVDAGTADGTRLTVNALDPEPDAGDTWSQGTFELAVHGRGTVPPACGRRTGSGGGYSSALFPPTPNA